MPELPEVETSRRGIEPYLVGHSIRYAVVRNAPALAGFRADPDAERSAGAQRAAPGQILLIELENGWIIVHLGMSGSLRMLRGKTKMKPANTTTSIW